jgi:cytosine/adenosine deaminase-related metal-dependent hydrolase
MPRSILIRDAAHVVTMSPGAPELGPGDVLIEGDRIAGVYRADADDRPSPEAVDDVVNAEGMLVLPGLVNTHHHFFQSLTRNLPMAQEARLFDWLVRHYDVWAGITGEMVDVAARVAIGELLLTGCTTTTDHHYLFPSAAPPNLIDRQVDAARELGIRFHPTRGSMEMGVSRGGLPPDALVETATAVLDDCRRLIDKVHDPAPRSMTRLALAPCAPFNVSETLMRKTAALARQHGLRLHTHLGETQDEVDYCLRTFGVRPLAYADRLGWVEDDVWLAHAVVFDDEEIALMGRRGMGIAHCPSSNLRLGSGVAPVRRYLDAGVTVGLGVDGSASNDSSNLLGELRQGLLIHRLGPDADWLTAREVMEMATVNGAKVLGRDDIGRLEPGLAADVVLIDMDQLAYAGAKGDRLAAVVFNQALRPVDMVIVNGRVVVRARELTHADERALVREADRLAGELRGAMER